MESLEEQLYWPQSLDVKSTTPKTSIKPFAQDSKVAGLNQKFLSVANYSLMLSYDGNYFRRLNIPSI